MPKTLMIDTREKPKATRNIIEYFDRKGIDHVSSKLYVADYQMLDNPMVVVDRKYNLQEVCGNLTQDHARLARECDRARQHGIQIFFLVQNTENIRTLDDVHQWSNRRYQKWAANPVGRSPTSSETLEKMMRTFAEHHGVKWYFCSPKSTGRAIIYLLTGKDLGA